jgi:hypothetical protein
MVMPGDAMIRESRWMVRLSPVMGERVRMRAVAQGISIAEYLRTTIEKDLQKGGDADALARLNTEITLVVGMMVRELLTRSMGRDEAKNLEEWANGRASGIIQEEIQERQAGA